MSIAVSRLLRLGFTVAVGCVLAAGVAFAGTVTTPSSSPFTVPGDAGANPLPFTVVASGYTPGVNVLITQCDGLDPTDANWSVAIDCDFGLAPGPVSADGSGVATFDGSHAFQAFKDGNDVQSKFNCIAPDEGPSANGLPDWTNCRLRVSTNNSAFTSDQAFLVLKMPSSGSGGSTTTTTGGTTTTTESTTTTTESTTTTTVADTTTSTSVGDTTTSTSVGATTTTIAACVTTTTVPCSTTTTFSTSATTDTTLAVASVSAGSGSGSLPRTGSTPMLPLAGAGVVMIGTGLGIAVRRRRRMA